MQKASVRENWFLAWRHQLEATSEEIMNHERIIFSTVSEGKFGSFSVLFATCFVLRCYVVLLRRNVIFCHSGSS